MKEKNVDNIPFPKVRDRSLDMAKGILIAMLIFHHINDTRHMVGIENDLIEFMRMIQTPLIVCYFMPAFFLISGMCSNFQKEFRPFLIAQIKGLIIPAISFILLFHLYQGESPRQLCGTIMRLFLYGKDYWFLIALFEAKILYYFLRRGIQNDRLLLLLLLLLSFSGALLNDLDKVQNFFMHRHTLDLMFFVGVGNMFKSKIRDNKVQIISLLVFVIICTVLLLLDYKIPYVTYTFGTTSLLWPLHAILSFSGSIIILALCQRLPNRSLIEYMGRNSLAIFLMQWYTLIMFMECFKEALNHCPIKESMVLTSVIFISTIAIGLLVAHVTNTTKLRFLMGKF